MTVEVATYDEEKQPLQAAESGAVNSVHGWMWRLVLLLFGFSLLLNLHLWMAHYHSCSLDPAQGPLELLSYLYKRSAAAEWAHPAALTAETLAGVDCSRHGSVFFDTLQVSDDPSDMVCECHACFTGPNCAESIPECVALVDSGDPVMYEYFWKQNAESGTLVTPPWYRMSYAEGVDRLSRMTKALENQIRLLHKRAGNVVAEDKTLVATAGSTQMIFAVVQTLLGQGIEPSAVVSAYPFYELYRRQSNAFGNGLYEWGGDARMFDQQEGNPQKKTVEIVTYPNNPDFVCREPLLHRNNSYTVYDFAYNWPHMQPVSREFDEDIMIFTLSKITGHAGTRLGWAFFRDPEMAKAVNLIITANSMTLSRDSIARASQLLKTVLAGYDKDTQPVPLNLPAEEYAKQGRIFHYGRAVLSKRYKWLVDILRLSSRFSILQHEPEFSHFFGQTVDPSPAYAWITCNRPEEEDCYTFLLNNGIKTYAGESYGMSNRYVRFSLLKRDSDYEVLEKNLLKLVAA